MGKMGKQKKRSKLTAILSFLLSVAMIGSLAVFASSPGTTLANVDLPGNTVSSYMNNRAGVMLSEVVGIDNVRVLPYDFSVPLSAPNANNYYTRDGKSCYADKTIEVKCWSETLTSHKYGNVPVYFSEVTVKHASQFRRQWANGDYNSKSYQYPSNMFNSSNGVVAMSADFYKHRMYGIIIQYGTVICDKRGTSILDVLTVDYDGNFKIWRDTELSKRITEEGADDIMLSFTFGPVLVQDGQVVDESHWERQTLGELSTTVGRAAIGQLGELHYLLCTVSNPGMTCAEMAQTMADKGCIIAYNLDGGQSGTMLFDGKVYNKIAYKGVERAMSDILYFASAE